MSAAAVNVLFVGRNVKGCSLLLEHLERRGCQCRIATSSSEAAQLAAERRFDLVLCSGQMEGINSLVRSFVGSPSILFRFYLVENGCWWLPAVWQGEECSGAPALRPSEFAAILNSLVDKVKADALPAREAILTSGGNGDTPSGKRVRESPADGPGNNFIRRAVLNV